MDTQQISVEEHQMVLGIGQLLARQQVDVLHAQVDGEAHDGRLLVIRRDVCHQCEVFHETAGLALGLGWRREHDAL